MTTRQPYHDGECECGREPGQCIKGDMDHCPIDDDYDEEDDEGSREADCGRWDNGNLISSCRLAASGATGNVRSVCLDGAQRDNKGTQYR